jgi:hypothetical protein
VTPFDPWHSVEPDACQQKRLIREAPMTLALRHADPVAENLQKHDDLRFPGAVVAIFLDAHDKCA